jgi:hypothetical protein
MILKYFILKLRDDSNEKLKLDTVRIMPKKTLDFLNLNDYSP